VGMVAYCDCSSIFHFQEMTTKPFKTPVGASGVFSGLPGKSRSALSQLCEAGLCRSREGASSQAVEGPCPSWSRQGQPGSVREWRQENDGNVRNL
jgi:hypothetical protein